MIVWAYGPLEAFPMDRIRRQFDTNVIGLLETTKAVLPHLREQGAGTIVNISSIGGQMTFPLGALYHGSKFAVEGISESLHYELAAAGIKVKIVQPGMIATDFGGRSFDFVNDESLSEYQPVVQALFTTWGGEDATSRASQPIVVAEVIYDAVTDGTDAARSADHGATKANDRFGESESLCLVASGTAAMGRSAKGMGDLSVEHAATDLTADESPLCELGFIAACARSTEFGCGAAISYRAAE